MTHPYLDDLWERDPIISANPYPLNEYHPAIACLLVAVIVVLLCAASVNFAAWLGG